MRVGAAALSALLASLLLAVPADGATRKQVQAAAFAVPTPTAPVRDVVIKRPSRAAARVPTSASLGRYQVDGAGRSVEIVNNCVPIICQATPESVAATLGALLHDDEMNLLTVFLVTPTEMTARCGEGAQACYFPSLQRMVINGDTSPADDGAAWEFVVAHEYGHHLANNRNNSPFDNPAVDWGPKRWASYHRVCQGVASRTYFPGNQGLHYFENPGEAFAESFAFTHFPTAPVPWAWIASLRPDANTYVAIQRDALDPWNGTITEKRRGHFPKKRRPRKKAKRFATPLDGDMTLKLYGPDRADLALKLKGPDGRVLERSDGVGSKESVSFRLCGEQSVTAVVRRPGRRLTRFKMTAQLP